MDIRDKVQIDAIKDREEYSICEYGTHVLIYKRNIWSVCSGGNIDAKSKAI